MRKKRHILLFSWDNGSDETLALQAALVQPYDDLFDQPSSSVQGVYLDLSSSPHLKIAIVHFFPCQSNVIWQKVTQLPAL